MKIDDFRKLASFEFQYSREDQQRLHDFLRTIGIDPTNIYQELEMSSPYVNTHRDTSFSIARVSLHSHTFYEMIYCREARNVEYLVGSQRYRLRNGDIIFISPGISHRPILPEHMDGSYVRDVVWISPEFMAQLHRMFPHEVARNGEYLIRTAGTRWEFLGDLFAAGIREKEEKSMGWEPMVFANTLQILIHLDRAYHDRSAGVMKAEKPDLLGKVTAYIESHYAEHITISELSRRFYVSESTIGHQFKQKMGISIYNYVTQRRLISAKTLISEGMALEQVGAKVGFSDYSAFYRAFKQEYGISPRQYRNLQG